MNIQGKTNDQNYFLIIDVEATCWEGPNIHQGENEIIEIGFAIVDFSNELVVHGGWFMRPVRNPELSEFCKKLTSIKQEDVDNASMFPEVMEKFASTVHETTTCALNECIFVSWGNYDRILRLHGEKRRFTHPELLGFGKP